MLTPIAPQILTPLRYSFLWYIHQSRAANVGLLRSIVRAYPIFKLGRVLDDGSNRQSLYQRQYNDLLKLWLFTEGPTKMLQFCGAEHPQNTHVCEDCLNLLLNEQHLRRLMSISQEKANSLMLSYQLKAAQQC